MRISDWSSDVCSSDLGGASADRSGRGEPDRLLSSWSSSYQAVLDASYEIDLWGANRASVAAARARTASSRFDRDTVALTLAADVATAWRQSAALGDQIRPADATLPAAGGIPARVEAHATSGAAGQRVAARDVPRGG